MKLDTRYITGPLASIRIENRADGQKPMLVGYGAVFYRESSPGTEYNFDGIWSSFRERILPGAFDIAIREDDVRALFNHDVNELLGRTASRTLRLSVDSVGLRYEIDPPDTESAKRVVEAVRRGDLSGSSFSFTVEEENWRSIKSDGDKEVNIRELVSVRLYDVGPVTFPAYQAATAGVRSVGDLEEARQSFERWKQKQTNEQNRVAAKICQAQAHARSRSI